MSTLASRTNSDPSVRLFEYDNNTFVLKDFTTYYMNLTKANKNNVIKWEKLYSAADDFGINNLSAENMYSEYKKMKSSTGEFNRVYKRRKAVMSSCSSTCRKKALCSMAYTEVTSYEDCIK